MRTGIATVCLSGTLKEKMQACAIAGFDGIEIFEQDLVTSPLSPEDIRKMAADLGLGLDLYQPFRDFDGVTPDLLKANLKRAEAKFKLMARLGMDTILVCSNVATATIDDDQLRAEQLALLAALAGDHGVKVAYEALAWGKHVNDYEHAYRLVEAVDHPNLGTCLDSFHILSRDWDTAPIEDINADKIFFVQVADAPKLSMDVLSWSRHYRVFPGEGQFELAKFMGHVVRAGYTGPVSLEVFNDVFRQSDVERTAVDAMRSLIWLEEQSAKWLAGTSAETAAAGTSEQKAAGRRRYPMELATLPKVNEPAGFNFAEVKADDTAQLEKLLGQLGFEFEGRHRTKDVQLWTMGQARVIINEQAALHTEPAIAALGFDVDSPVIASARAQQLKAPVVSRKVQADEEVFQGISAPDSTEIFLCQGSPDGTAAWTQEFGEGLEHPRAAQTAVIDHVNLAQPWQHFDEAVLFYTSALALEPQPFAEVPSPSGLVRSQVMQASNGAVRLVLNLAPVQQASAPKTYQEHIAFAVDDLVATARSARERGLEFLQIPANYYEDLDARFDLEPGFLATLKELNLLYDRDANGEFLHFYTATVGSVFFEMVERRGNYDGYGAPNAPVRHAVQYDSLHRA
ncbi:MULTISPECIES: bifunctional sugar phosphate isomerase/epimerase/4-hydroxyphenylpyruvate dioxygenase family protein [Paenarthrobacter]|uniref:3-dehydroshikimate dehydratase n=1 Tax=Paenarthrobacter ureafaciens TaxID=37931 RepID=A0AAX3EHN0_PAEUR|nr:MULTISPECIES: sugar phosphate isomerase/epimerase and 4-hydroxyphenylpyruvate domain-containing protein [Paenarthrobacter]NKR13655.1 4-hydroxyphenylpyruvate dioxygenase [Arthrobacter sp. M5]NKR17680.1 4-hydroxyphenylpyruvate dioxygenase [Arthrobacter sp. M6]OEH58151.1 4-hydroxyphenylpyruvate dioxygenase [Arthrobacter sp. D4]OEH58241.1 4-hydroxyphenylpyruvate dioxygenase [Arthrobacter sp. D2]MDO5866663.1 sugar phosphate isomerase/epimerase and 4-hydroxyphenylpyruvate domain-containing protei